MKENEWELSRMGRELLEKKIWNKIKKELVFIINSVDKDMKI